MTTAELITKIRAKIERLKADYLNRSYTFVPKAMDDLLDFLDTLEEPVCEELKEAAEKYAYTGTSDELKSLLKPIADEIVKHFIAGAKWQYQKDRGEFAKIKAKTWCEGFDACKEQMMKEAVEGEVMTNGFYPYEPKIVISFPDCPYDFGDKVKLIIVKEDEK